MPKVVPQVIENVHDVMFIVTLFGKRPELFLCPYIQY